MSYKTLVGFDSLRGALFVDLPYCYHLWWIKIINVSLYIFSYSAFELQVCA